MEQPPPLPPAPAPEPPPLSAVWPSNPAPASPGALPYATPAPRGSLPRAFDRGLFGFSAALVWSWVVFMIFAVPHFMEVFMDYKLRPGLTTRILFGLHVVVLWGGWVLLLPIPVGLGFAGAQMDPTRRRAARRLVMLIMGALLVLAIFGIGLPYITLIQGMTSGKR